MAAATVPYGTTQPLAQHFYQPTPSESEYHALKRTYLALLPPPQIIEICLTFEVHVPLNVRASVWPVDLKTAIATMQSQQPRSSTPSPADVPPKSPLRNDAQPMAALRDTSHPAPPEKPPEMTSPVPEAKKSAPSQPAAFSQTVTTTIPTHPPGPSVQPAYPHQPYGYSHHQVSYPHAPYYSGSPATGYSYTYPAYPPPTTYPQGTAAAPTPFPNNLSTPLPHHGAEVQLSAEDLPSYEDLIVEALMECTDPEGTAPKNIFTWMCSRYPLQANFRPSASQALQKAFKRGRLEKSDSGKYRLNPLWEGGSTTRRHTRRPQTEKQNQTSTSSADRPPKSSPFTRAPLENKRPTPSTSANTGQPSYPYPYPYPPPPLPQAYPAYPTHPAPAPDEETGEGSDAWEAAQNILKAINFGALIQFGQEGRKDAGEAEDIAANGVTRDVAGHPPPVVASSNMDITMMGQTRGAGPSQVVEAVGGTVPIQLNADDRAALQAQLALLAAQMAELAEGEDDVFAHGLSTAMAGVPVTNVDETKMGDHEGGGEHNGGGDEDDEDEDMELVDVPS